MCFVLLWRQKVCGEIRQTLDAKNAPVILG
jgi:hypothetical protein